jgi:hypothetical protein
MNFKIKILLNMKLKIDGELLSDGTLKGISKIAWGNLCLQA